MEKIYILCVDDQREVLRSVARDLQEFSEWTVLEECESASEAGEIIEELEMDGKPLGLIVCDHIMPGQTGVAFLADIQRSPRHKNVKKVLITGQATHTDTIHAVNEAKIDGYIEKPWDPKQLKEICLRLLTEYLFDSGRDPNAYRKYLDPQVMLARSLGGK